MAVSGDMLLTRGQNKDSLLLIMEKFGSNEEKARIQLAVTEGELRIVTGEQMRAAYGVVTRLA